MDFEIVSDLTQVETIAIGSGIRELRRLRRLYGAGRWRKMKGVASIGTVGCASQNCTGMKHTVSARKSSNVSATSTRSRKRVAERQFAVCVNNAGYEASLERNKIYVIVPDTDAKRDGDIRVVDESGEDYLFAADRFVAIDVPAAVQASLMKAS